MNSKCEVFAVSDLDFSVDLLSRAQEYLQNKNYAAAEPLFSAFTVTNPKDPRGWWGLILCKTQNFTLPLEDVTDIQNWFSYIRTHAQKDDLVQMQMQYAAYWEKSSLTLACQLKRELEELKSDPATLLRQQEAELSALQQQLQAEQKNFAEITVQCERGILQEKQTAHRYNRAMRFTGIGAGICLTAPVFLMIILPFFENLWIITVGAAFFLFVAFIIIAQIKPESQIYYHKKRLSEATEKHNEKVTSLKNKIHQLTLTQSNTAMVLRSYHTLTECDAQQIAQILTCYRAQSNEPDSITQHKVARDILSALNFCPLCGRTHNEKCPLCGQTHGQSTAQDAMRRSLTQMGKQEFLLEAERFSTTCELEDYIEKYLAEHPHGIDPRIVELVKKQAKIERSYGTNKTRTIKMIQLLE